MKQKESHIGVLRRRGAGWGNVGGADENREEELAGGTPSGAGDENREEELAGGT